MKNLPDTFDFGETKANTYTNSYFGLQFTFPKDWSVQSESDIKAITAQGEKYFLKDNSKLKSALKASQINIAYLFSIFKNPTKQQSTIYNPSLSVIAENISGTPDITRGRDYLFNAKALLQETKANYTFESDFDSDTIDDEIFDIMHAQVKLGNYTIKQEYYSTIRYNFSLSFILSYTNEAEKEALHKILNSISLD